MAVRHVKMLKQNQNNQNRTMFQRFIRLNCNLAIRNWMKLWTNSQANMFALKTFHTSHLFDTNQCMCTLFFYFLFPIFFCCFIARSGIVITFVFFTIFFLFCSYFYWTLQHICNTHACKKLHFCMSFYYFAYTQAKCTLVLYLWLKYIWNVFFTCFFHLLCHSTFNFSLQMKGIPSTDLKWE